MSKQPNSGTVFSTSAGNVLRLCILIIAIGTSLFLHRRGGLTFPLPWPDESVFLWPAKALADQGAWIAPQLNGSRPILWMPPGYTVVMAAVFRWAPWSLNVARWVSWLFSAGALIGIFCLFQRQRGSLYDLPILAAIAIVPSWVIAGNIARMEALLLLTTIWGFFLLASGHQWKGLALLAFGPLVHPNGVIFLGAGLLSVAFGQRSGRSRPTVNDWVILGLVLLAYVAYGVFVFRYREAFLHDMGYQLARKGSWSVVGALLTRRSLALAIGILGAGVASRLVWGWIRPSLWLTAAGCAIPILSGEMWYVIFADFGILLLLAEWLDIAAAIRFPAIGRINLGALPKAGFLRVVILTVALAASLRLARWLEVTASPRDLPGNVSWECMRMQRAPYVEESEGRVVREAISRAARSERAYRVGFDPPSDGLLFDGSYLPFFPVFSEERDDLVTIHVTPDWRACEPEQDLRLQHKLKSQIVLFHYQRDVNHQWYVFQSPK